MNHCQTLKEEQLLPLKFTKRVIKIWQKCNAFTINALNLYIFQGKEAEFAEKTLEKRTIINNPRVKCYSIPILHGQHPLCFGHFYSITKCP